MPKTCMCCANFGPIARSLVAVGACAINGGLPAQRNQLDVGQMLRDVYCTQTGMQRTQPDSQ